MPTQSVESDMNLNDTSADYYLQHAKHSITTSREAHIFHLSFKPIHAQRPRQVRLLRPINSLSKTWQHVLHNRLLKPHTTTNPTLLSLAPEFSKHQLGLLRAHQIVKSLFLASFNGRDRQSNRHKAGCTAQHTWRHQTRTLAVLRSLESPTTLAPTKNESAHFPARSSITHKEQEQRGVKGKVSNEGLEAAAKKSRESVGATLSAKESQAQSVAG